MDDNKRVTITYIDDRIETYLSKYLDNEYNGKNLDYNEVMFESDKGFESILNNSIVQNSNILIMDSWLFESDHKDQLVGEEISLIIRKDFPFIKIIIVSQNDKMTLDTVKKFDSSLLGVGQELANKHYNKNLRPFLDEKIKEHRNEMKVLDKFKLNNSIDANVRETVDNLINGISTYKEMTSDDINDLIDGFKKVAESFEKIK